MRNKIAIIGSAPRIFSNEHGVEIDSHGIVIRVNFAALNLCYNHTGYKTDIWSNGANMKIARNINYFRVFEEVWINPGRMAKTIPIISSRGKKVRVFPFEESQRISRELGERGYHPTLKLRASAGYLTVLKALEIFPDKHLDLYGFSCSGSISHYYDDEVGPDFHRFEGEREFYKEHERISTH